MLVNTPETISAHLTIQNVDKFIDILENAVTQLIKIPEDLEKNDYRELRNIDSGSVIRCTITNFKTFYNLLNNMPVENLGFICDLELVDNTYISQIVEKYNFDEIDDDFIIKNHGKVNMFYYTKRELENLSENILEKYYYNFNWEEISKLKLSGDFIVRNIMKLNLDLVIKNRFEINEKIMLYTKEDVLDIINSNLNFSKQEIENRIGDIGNIMYRLEKFVDDVLDSSIVILGIDNNIVEKEYLNRQININRIIDFI